MSTTTTTTEATARRSAQRAIAQRVAAMDPDERAAYAARTPIRTIEGKSLSAFNACMVIYQNAGATIVGGFRQWLAAGRCVRKGEHGMAVWVPVRRKAEDGAQVPAGDDPAGFILGTVFDVSQTDPLPTDERDQT